MEFLKSVLGDELYGKVEAEISAYNAADGHKDKPVKLANLTDGGYVSLEKYQALETKSAGLEKQLGEANEAIQSYKDMDIDGIRKSVTDWEEKYNTDTQALQKRLEGQQREFAAERFLDSQKIKSPLSRKAILQEFLSQGLELKDGAFVGADEYMKGLKEKYPDEFEKEEGAGAKKAWVRGTQGTYRPRTRSEEEAYAEKKYGSNKYYNQ